MEIARQLDPLSVIIQEGRGYLLTLARRYDEAIAVYRALAELDSSFYKAYTSMGRAYSLKGMYGAAIAMLEKGRAMAGEVPSVLGVLGALGHRGLPRCFAGCDSRHNWPAACR
jgi:serine/threonine-protein kinase